MSTTEPHGSPGGHGPAHEPAHDLDLPPDEFEPESFEPELTAEHDELTAEPESELDLEQGFEPGAVPGTEEILVGESRGGNGVVAAGRRRRIKQIKMFAVLPTMLTLSNAACGFGAITFAAKLGPTPNASLGGNELLVAAGLIYLAMVFDALDGSAARLVKQTSDFGAQLDSLCDAISFGVAPAYLMLQVMVHSFGADVIGRINYPPRVLWVIAVLFVMCAILRLARFNVETDEEDSHDHFSGLPSPAAAGVVASFPVAMHWLTEVMHDTRGTVAYDAAASMLPAIKLLLPLITAAVACLMVSRFRYNHVFNQLFRGRRGRRHIIQLVLTITTVIAVHELAVPVIFLYFAFATPVAWGLGELTRRARPGQV